MNKKINCIAVAEVILIIAVLILGGYNILGLKNSDFWKCSATQILTLLIAIIIAFWATQRKTDERKIKEQVEKITTTMQNVVSSSEFVSFNTSSDPTEVQKQLTMTIRKLKNCVNVLRGYSKKLDITDDVNYLDDQIRGYNDFVSVKVGDLDYLAKSESHLRLYAENIIGKCDYIILQLYTKL